MSRNAPHIYDVSREAVEQLTAARGRSESVAGLLRALVAPLQGAEDARLDLSHALSIEGATGVWLDFFGRIVGEPRGDMPDREYRRHIQARVQINASQGEHNRILRIAELLTDASFVQITPAYPAAYTLLIVSAEQLDARALARVRDRIEQATAAGVAVHLVSSNQPGAVFRFDLSGMPRAGQPGDGMPRAF